MTRKLAHIERITALTPIMGADLIERATIGGWGIVVKKGTFQIDQLAAFFEIDTLLPLRPWSSFLFKDKRELYRLRTIKLKGTLSQGLLVPIAEIPELAGCEWVEGDDVTEILTLSKWEPVIPANLAGQIKGNFPPFLRKSDEERIQNAKGVLDEIGSIDLSVRLKMDGTSFTAYRHEGVFGVCSRNLDLREEGGDDYWAMAKATRLHEMLAEGFAIQAELCGPGIQGNKMGLTEKTLYVFNGWRISDQQYLDDVTLVGFAESLGLQMAPYVHIFDDNSPVRPHTMEEWLALADKVKYSNGAQAEGIVVRPIKECYSRALDGRLSFKVIANSFLLKHADS